MKKRRNCQLYTTFLKQPISGGFHAAFFSSFFSTKQVLTWYNVAQVTWTWLEQSRCSKQRTTPGSPPLLTSSKWAFPMSLTTSAQTPTNCESLLLLCLWLHPLRHLQTSSHYHCCHCCSSSVSHTFCSFTPYTVVYNYNSVVSIHYPWWSTAGA